MATAITGAIFLYIVTPFTHFHELLFPRFPFLMICFILPHFHKFHEAIADLDSVVVVPWHRSSHVLCSLSLASESKYLEFCRYLSCGFTSNARLATHSSNNIS